MSKIRHTTSSSCSSLVQKLTTLIHSAKQQNWMFSIFLINCTLSARLQTLPPDLGRSTPYRWLSESRSKFCMHVINVDQHQLLVMLLGLELVFLLAITAFPMVAVLWRRVMRISLHIKNGFKVAVFHAKTGLLLNVSDSADEMKNEMKMKRIQR
ncbi:hypothetical protein scyTo_0011231 [Scyliorhinus torazame]|uniref:Uncharacterized protein n=1 Tax=Scyliorhinus torazame TaxID=75743 RepID=A0A401NJD9_SCYTO|nr:hypothetical protein [Scyliorhinus torazame]